MAPRSWPRLTLPVAPDTAVISTAGDRLAHVVTIDDLGRYVLEDFHTEIVEDPKTGRRDIVESRFEVTVAVLVRDWRLLRAPADLTPEEALAA